MKSTLTGTPIALRSGRVLGFFVCDFLEIVSHT
jgi:hypothetical protein